MDELLGNYLYYEDYISKSKDENENYMNRIGVLENIKLFSVINGKLLYRMVIKGWKQHEV